jgi:hypothetical protein|tara:strand:+ start:3887 stop:4087 length:201 start_codon:yes stop_codon:yes gene_type:complete
MSDTQRIINRIKKEMNHLDEWRIQSKIKTQLDLKNRDVEFQNEYQAKREKYMKLSGKLQNILTQIN